MKYLHLLLCLVTVTHRVAAFTSGGRLTRDVASTSSASSLASRVSSFTSTQPRTISTTLRSNCAGNTRLYSRVITKFTDVDFQNEQINTASFDPLGCSDTWSDITSHHIVDCKSCNAQNEKSPNSLLALVPFAITATNPSSSFAASTPLSTGDFNPDSFRPVCSASDSFYRFLQGSTRAVVGDENFSEYGPLIAGGLLRIRLELCVVESFFNEAVGPFIKENGLSWILPLHETVETFIAGSIFALATTFILVGSTKLIQIIAFYGDLIVGAPCRLLGGFFFDRARGEPVTLDVSFFGFFKTRLVGPPVDFKEEEKRKKAGGVVEEKLLDLDKVEAKDFPLLVVSGGVKLVGETAKIFREFIEALDLFVGRYLVLLASGYIIVKFVHFKIFPDFP
ncbi:predicted protein [Thalassiosira pseudonana CCMP1335]|uniref:Uncharacterized protein n=1 Tax=Thalassiosira pseudonana TaxID=35128 RepID=B8C5B6_THAPS|nr:predicted protein [Thalassiosira pseudonana CCMP1335]EED91089.1 predicted protein [Thalassiosira pseudonana CCMP1335]